MGFKDGLKKHKDGTYILSHKSKEAKEGDCIEGGQNPKSRTLMFKYNTEDFKLVREYVHDHLTTYSNSKSMKPIWCKKCQSLIEYKVTLKDNKNK